MGSEMCIRDSLESDHRKVCEPSHCKEILWPCNLYTAISLLKFGLSTELINQIFMYHSPTDTAPQFLFLFLIIKMYIYCKYFESFKAYPLFLFPSLMTDDFSIFETFMFSLIKPGSHLRHNRDLQIRLRVRVRLLSARGLGLSCRRHCCCRRQLATKIFQ